MLVAQNKRFEITAYVCDILHGKLKNNMVIGLLFLFLCNTTTARVVAPPHARPKITIPTVDYIEEQRKGFDLSLDIITKDIEARNGNPVDRKRSFSESFGPTIERFEQWILHPGVF